MMKVCAGFLLLATTVAFAAEPPRVQGISLKNDREMWTDRSLDLQEHFGGLSPGASAGEQSLGFTPDAHLRFLLGDSGLVAFMPRTESNEKLLKTLGRNDRITVTGVLRREGYRPPSKTVMAGDLDITTHYARRDVHVMDVATVKRGWAQDPPYLLEPPEVKDYAPVEQEALEGNLEALSGKRIRLGVGAGELSYSRAFDVTDATLGFNLENSVRFRYRPQGPFLYTQRTPETLNTLTSVEPRDIIQLWLRVVKADTGQFRLVVDKVIVMVPRH